MGDLAAGLERFQGIANDERAACAAAVGNELTEAELQAAGSETKSSWLNALLALVDKGEGTCTDRLSIGEFLARLGDPRIAIPVKMPTG